MNASTYHPAGLDAYARLEAAQRLHDDLTLLRVTAGLPKDGPLDALRLRQSISDCCEGNLADCPSCAALSAVLTAEAS